MSTFANYLYWDDFLLTLCYETVIYKTSIRNKAFQNYGNPCNNRCRLRRRGFADKSYTNICSVSQIKSNVYVIANNHSDYCYKKSFVSASLKSICLNVSPSLYNNVSFWFFIIYLSLNKKWSEWIWYFNINL